jgi:hypothetical protein
MKTMALLVAGILMVSGNTAGRAGAPAQRRVPERRLSVTGLDTIARDLSDKAIEAWNAARSQRRDTPVDIYLALGGFSGAAQAYSQMAADRREESDLRLGARTLIAQAREIDALYDRMATERYQWPRAQEHVAKLSDYFNLGYQAPRRGRFGDSGRDRRGSNEAKFRWRGRVDGRDYIVVHGSSARIRHVENNNITEVSYDFFEPLPSRGLTVRLTKLHGRGTVQITEQPSSSNDYTLIVLIDDPSGGTDFYEFELSW